MVVVCLLEGALGVFDLLMKANGEEKMAKKEICIIGAGNGGSAIAGDMTLAGHRCRLFEFPEYAENIKPIIAQGGIHVTGIARTGFAKIALATIDLSEAVRGAKDRNLL